MRPFVLLLLVIGLSSCSTVHPNLEHGARASQQFQTTNTGHIVAPAEINGHSVFLVIDTGAGATVIDRSSVAALDLRVPGKESSAATSASDAGIAIQSSPGNHFKFAGTESEDFTFRIMDLGHVVKALSSQAHPVVGVVGVDWLDRHGATIKYSDRTITATK